MKISLTVYGKPVPQGRPRFARVGGFVKPYDPQKSGSWKDSIKWQAIQQKAPMLVGALAMKLIFCLDKPKSTPRKVLYPAKKPDLDNFIKAVEDALEGVCYKNDSQIVQIQAIKAYCAKDYEERPCVKIEIVELQH